MKRDREIETKRCYTMSYACHTIYCFVCIRSNRGDALHVHRCVIIRNDKSQYVQIFIYKRLFLCICVSVFVYVCIFRWSLKRGFQCWQYFRKRRSIKVFLFILWVIMSPQDWCICLTWVRCFSSIYWIIWSKFSLKYLNCLLVTWWIYIVLNLIRK